MSNQINLDDLKTIEQCDQQGMLPTLQRFDRQLEEALEIGERIKLFDAPTAFRNVLVCGMGGSAIAGDFLKAYLGGGLAVPIGVNRNYSLPAFVSPSTLSLICSYSGNTEETLSAFQQARQMGSQIICSTSNGKLQRLVAKYGYPSLRLPTGYAPRAALGYLAIPLSIVLARLDLISVHPLTEIRHSIRWVQDRCQAFSSVQSIQDNPAKQLALQISGRIPVIYGSQDRLEMVAVRWRGQFAENGKQLSYCSILPEMNHNEIVGWKHPEKLLRQMAPIFLRDKGDDPRIQRRIEITRDLVAQKSGVCLEYWSDGKNWLERLWSLILLGDYASVYLAFLNRENPYPVDVIDFLKKRLRQAC